MVPSKTIAKFPSMTKHIIWNGVLKADVWFPSCDVMTWEQFQHCLPLWGDRQWWPVDTLLRASNAELWFLAATKQLYEWFSPSVYLSVCLSVRLSVMPFWLCSHHRIIMNVSGVITNDRSDVHAKGQRSKVKVTEVNTHLYCFQTITPAWIHIWWWNDAQSLMVLRKGALLFFKVILQIWRSHS